MAKTVGRLKDGSLLVSGAIDERTPPITDGLVSYFPFDGTDIGINTGDIFEYDGEFPTGNFTPKKSGLFDTLYIEADVIIYSYPSERYSFVRPTGPSTEGASSIYMSVDSAGKVSVYEYAKMSNGYHASNQKLNLNTWYKIAHLSTPDKTYILINGEVDRIIDNAQEYLPHIDTIHRETGGRLLDGIVANVKISSTSPFLTTFNNVDLKYDGATISRGATNLITDPTDPTKWIVSRDSTAGHVSEEIIDTEFGVKGFSKVTSGQSYLGTLVRPYWSGYDTINPDTYYTVSAYVRGYDFDGNSRVYFNIQGVDATGARRDTGDYHYITEEGWHRFTFTFKPSDVGMVSFVSYFKMYYQSMDGKARRIDVVMPQMENLPFATPFVIGNRANSSVSIPVRNVNLDTDPFSLIFRVKPNTDVSNYTNISNEYNGHGYAYTALLDFRTASGGRFDMWWDRDVNTVRMLSGYDVGGSWIDVGPRTALASDDITVAIVCDGYSTTTHVVMNGEHTKGTRVRTGDVGALSEIWLDGYGRGYQGSNTFQDVGLYDRALTDEEVFRFANLTYGFNEYGDLTTRNSNVKTQNLPADTYIIPLGSDAYDGNGYIGDNKVRYIRDKTEGSTSNTGNHWVEIQAIDVNGNNVAYGKTVTGIDTADPDSIVNNNTSTANYVHGGLSVTGSTDPYVYVDLGNAYELDHIKVWHYYGDGRTYHKTRTEVSLDGVNWMPIFNSAIDGEYPETSAGKTHYMNGKGPYVDARECVFENGAVGVFDATENLVTNPTFEALDNGNYDTAWDSSLHVGAVDPAGWSSGYNGGVASPEIGYHAHFVWEGMDGGVCVKFIDRNDLFGLGHRWLGVSGGHLNGGATLSSLGISAGTDITVSWWQKTDTLGKGAKAPIRYWSIASGAWVFPPINTYRDNTRVGVWERLHYTVTVTSDWDLTKSAYFYIYGHSGEHGTVWVDNLQAEIRSYMRPFVPSSKGQGNLFLNKGLISNYSSFTIGTWFMIPEVYKVSTGNTGITGNWHHPILEICPQTNLSSKKGYALMADPDGSGYLREIRFRGTDFEHITNYSINNGQWYFIVGTYDGANYRVYIDGEEILAYPSTTPPQIYDDTVIMLGGGYHGKANIWLRDAIIHNGVMTADEIRSVYRNHLRSSVDGIQVQGGIVTNANL